jgi:RNA polymerase sigma-54 factor
VIKHSLQLKLGQQLTMTPQLQQAIRMLQMSTLELQTEIQQALDSNLMLEEGAEEGEEYDDATDPASSETQSAQLQEGFEEHGSLPEIETPPATTADIPDELVVDSAWDDIYEPGLGTSSSSDDDDRPFEQGDESEDSLHQHLLWQMQLSHLSDRDETIAAAIIDAIDDNGLLTLTLEEIHDGLLADLADLEPSEVQTMLHLVQSFEPSGVGARDTRESLLIQLRHLPATTPYRDECRQLVNEYFELLANRDYTQIKRKLKLDDQQLAAMTRLIQSLNPRPGSHFGGERTEYIIPDVVVRKERDQWRVELNHEAAPRLRINNHYASLMRQVKGDDLTTLRSHLQEARWFIKSLQSRNETLLRVASAIVSHQQRFLEQGETGMKPLILADIANELGMHESTISRSTTRKYMHTPRGIYELKYFFSSHVATASGGECSSTAIRAMIKALVTSEPPQRPLSDQRIAEILTEKGINVARRTIAKYREAMAIPPSNERKRLS